MRLRYLPLILLAIAAWIGSVRLLFNLSFAWRGEYDARLYPHDGQIGLDALAFALLACLGYLFLSVAALIFFERWRRRRRR